MIGRFLLIVIKKGIRMQKKIIIIILILLVIIGFIKFPWFKHQTKVTEMEIVKVSPEYSWETFKPSFGDQFNYTYFQKLFIQQTAEYQQVLNIFYKNKECFEKLIKATNEMAVGREFSYYFLGHQWKDQLDYVPDGNYLKDYEDYFFSFKIDKIQESISVNYLYGNADEELYRQVKNNPELSEMLNDLGKDDEVMEMIFCKEGVWIRFIGPFFEEGVMAEVGYIYEGKDESYTKACKDECWIEPNWLVYVPYMPNIDGYIPDYRPRE